MMFGMATFRWTDTQRTDFAQRMRAARQHSGLLQKNAAQAIGIHAGSLSELEKTAIKSGHTAQAAKVYGVNAIWLQTGKGEMLQATPVLSDDAADVGAQLDKIESDAHRTQAIVMCRAFASLAQSGELEPLLGVLGVALGLPASQTKQSPAQSRRSGSGSGRA
jgi:transcriptional regulator with XRE-family HTH domain